jgi:hypothetical protein
MACRPSSVVRPSVVRRPSVSKNLKNLLLKYQPWDFDETSSEASWQCPLLNSFKEFSSMQNSGCHGNETKKL